MKKSPDPFWDFLGIAVRCNSHKEHYLEGTQQLAYLFASFKEHTKLIKIIQKLAAESNNSNSIDTTKYRERGTFTFEQKE